MNNSPPNTLNYGIISKRRNDLFGIAILSIMVFHFFLSCQNNNVYLITANTYIVLIGRVGVPVFFILSGMGLFFSMKKDNSLKNFYIKRFTRVLLPYLIVAIFFLGYINLVAGAMNIKAFLLNISLVSFFTNGNSHSWFIVSILIMYIIFPLLFKIYKSGKYCFIKTCVLVGIVVAINYLMFKYNNQFYKNTEVMFTRIPSFIIGCYIGELVYNKKQIKWQYWLLTLVGSVGYIYFSTREFLGDGKLQIHFVRYSETAYALLLIVVLPIILEAVNSVKLSKFLGFFGAMSLELYVVHVSLWNLMKKFGFSASNPLYYFLMLALSVLICYWLQKFDSYLSKKIVSKTISS